MGYPDELLKKNYVGNVVVLLYGKYYAIRQPDSGLTIPTGQENVLLGLSINPTSVDLKRVNTTIGQYTFRLVDKNLIITQAFSNNPQLTGTAVRIWIGRCTTVIDGAPFDFSSYFELPQTVVKKVDHSDNSYTFTVAEQTTVMGRPVFNTQTTVGAAILVGSTVFQASADISAFPSSGRLKIDKEIVTYTSLDLVNNRFNGVVRGVDSTTAATHALGVTIFNVYKTEDNPVTQILKFLISGGGGGTYDVWPEGLGINHNLVDVAGLENLRLLNFNLQTFRLFLYNIPNALSYIEQELLYPNNLRFAISSDSKITVVLLDQAVFGADVPVIDETTITDYPQWSIDDNMVTNQIVVDWDWDEASEMYKQHSVFEDATSIATFGLRQAIKIQSKGIVADHDGAALAQSRGNRLLQRFANPTPQVTLDTQIDKSLVDIGQKVQVKSSQIPTAFGSLQFSDYLEVLSRSVDHIEGKVQFLLAFTSYSGVRSAFIAPSDVVVSVAAQDELTVAPGRGAQYKIGWALRLWDEGANAYTADPANIISNIVGDTLFFDAPFATPVMATAHRLRFPAYDESVDDQHRYAYICDNLTEKFPDGTGAYGITF